MSAYIRAIVAATDLIFSDAATAKTVLKTHLPKLDDKKIDLAFMPRSQAPEDSTAATRSI